MTNAGLASLVYLLDANFNFDRNAAIDAEIEVIFSTFFLMLSFCVTGTCAVVCGYRYAYEK